MADAKSIDVTLNGLKMVFDSTTGSVVELSYPGVGTMVNAQPSNASVLDLACPTPWFEPLRLASRFSKNAKIEKTDGSITVSWDSLGASREFDKGGGCKLEPDAATDMYKWTPIPASEYNIGGKVSASVTFIAAPDGRSIIASCKIDNQSKYAIKQILFPDFDGILPFHGPDGTYFRSGGVNEKPFKTIKTSTRGCGFWAQDLAMNGKEFVPGAYFGTTLMINQWLDIGGLNGGMSLFRKRWGWEPDDSPWIARGSVWLKVSEFDSKLRMMWANKVDLKPGEKWESAEFWFTPHASGWAKGIEPYRDWAYENQSKRKYPVPEHVRKGLGFRTLFMSTVAFPGDPDADKFTIWKFSELPKLAGEAKECGLNEIVLWMWNAGLQLPVAPPFPQLGGEEGLAKAIAECKKMGVNVSLFVSFYSLAVPSASRYGLQVPASGGWTYHPELMPAFNPYYCNAFSTAGVDVTAPKWREDVLKSCKYLVDKLSCSIAWDQYAGFPGAPNLYDLTDQIREYATRKDPESTWSGESFSNVEMESLWLDYTWSWGSYGMWGDLHPFTSTFKAPRVNPNIDRSPVDVKYCFMDNLYMNVMPRKPGSTNGSAWIGDFADLKSALKQCAKLREQFMPYFTDGTLIGNCILTEEAPCAHVCSYVLPGRIMMIVMNETGKQSLTLKYDLAPWVGSRANWTMRSYNASGKLMESVTLKGESGQVITPPLEQYELVIYEFSTK